MFGPEACFPGIEQVPRLSSTVLKVVHRIAEYGDCLANVAGADILLRPRDDEAASQAEVEDIERHMEAVLEKFHDLQNQFVGCRSIDDEQKARRRIIRIRG